MSRAKICLRSAKSLQTFRRLRAVSGHVVRRCIRGRSQVGRGNYSSNLLMNRVSSGSAEPTMTTHKCGAHIHPIAVDRNARVCDCAQRPRTGRQHALMNVAVHTDHGGSSLCSHGCSCAQRPRTGRQYAVINAAVHGDRHDFNARSPTCAFRQTWVTSLMGPL